MKAYKVNVNGHNYEITIEEIDKKDIQAPAAAPAPAAPKAAAPAGGISVNAPMPGNILAVNVKNGDTVKKGAVLMILEAMKMENEILAPADGTVSLNVAKGATVDSGAVLCTIA